MSAVEALGTEEHDEPRWTFGDRLAKARKASGLTGEQMAARLSEILGTNISKQTIANWENDKNQPRRLLAVVNAWVDQCPPGFTTEWVLRSRCVTVLAGQGPDWYQPPLPMLRPLAVVGTT